MSSVTILKWLALNMNINYYSNLALESEKPWGFNAGLTFKLGKKNRK